MLGDRRIWPGGSRHRYHHHFSPLPLLRGARAGRGAQPGPTGAALVDQSPLPKASAFSPCKFQATTFPSEVNARSYPASKARGSESCWLSARRVPATCAWKQLERNRQCNMRRLLAGRPRFCFNTASNFKFLNTAQNTQKRYAPSLTARIL